MGTWQPPTLAMASGFVASMHGQHRRMSRRVTYEQAGAILGCHVSNVAKLVTKGQLASTGQRGGSFDQDQVEALAARRTAGRTARAFEATTPIPARRPPT